MDTSNTLVQTDVNQVYYHASDLLYNQKLTAEEAKNALVIEKGVTENVAQAVIDTLERQIKAKKDAAQKDMVYGALWCVGGTVATWHI